MRHTSVARSRDKVSNGTRLLPADVDMRSRQGRRMKHLVAAFTSSLGIPAPNELEQAQIKQLAALTLAAERLATSVVKGDAVPMDEIIRVNSETRRLMKSLGVKPAAESKPADPQRALDAIFDEIAAEREA